MSDVGTIDFLPERVRHSGANGSLMKLSTAGRETIVRSTYVQSLTARKKTNNP
jgi:hypothetical protein